MAITMKILSGHRKYETYLGYVISIVLIYLIATTIDFQTVLEILGAFDVRLLGALALLYAYGITIRTVRWRCLIEQEREIPFFSVLRANAIGFMVNNLVPLRIGEVAKAEYIAREHSFSRGFLLGTVFAERMLDSLLLLIFLVVSALFSQTLIRLIHTKAWALVGVAAAMALAAVCLLHGPFRTALLRACPARHRRHVAGMAERAAKAVGFTRTRRSLALMVALTLMIWLGTLLSCFLILWGLGIVLPCHAYIFIVSVGALGMVIPSSPGNVGVYHAVAMGAVMLFMVDKERALTYAIISHAADLVPNVLFGGIVSLERVLPWRVLSGQPKRADGPPSEAGLSGGDTERPESKGPVSVVPPEGIA
ncbi:MAG: flippase-like domain-containing protein [Deltaproteobacteria bacterium]|nr:flippase-like domain-containing protein [Deltaproteobacteria bacterium]